MKKLLVVALAIITAFSCFSMVACGGGSKEDATIDGITYTYSEDLKGYVVSSYEGSETKVVIKDKVNGANVVEIGKNSFKGNKTITEVTLPNTIVTINDRAFETCTKLAKINFEEGLKTIGVNTFAGCFALTEVSFPKSLAEIKISAFDGCVTLTRIRYAGLKEQFNTTGGPFHNGALKIAVTAFDGAPVELVICADGSFNNANNNEVDMILGKPQIR